MNLSNEIAEMLTGMMSDSGEYEFRRNDLASRLGCAPSQINYVITSRFTPERGYLVESRRGGGGYIKITRVCLATPTAKIMHLVTSLGDSVDENTCRADLANLVSDGVIDSAVASVMFGALTENCYKQAQKELRSQLRASVFKNMLVALAAQKEE